MDPDEGYCQCGPIRNRNQWPGLPGLIPDRIIGGTTANPHQYPFQVALMYLDYFFCGGALITMKHVLTAAHCTQFMTDIDAGNDFKVMIAEHDLTTTNDCAYLADIEQIIQHPGYDPNEFDLDYRLEINFHLRVNR